MITTSDFFAKAYIKAGGRATLTPRELLATADSLYIVWRNKKVEQWSTAVFQKHGLKLLDYQDRLLDMMDATDQDYYNSMATCDLWGTDEEIALCLAQAVAVLRWWHNVYAGRVSERFPSSLKQAEHWLEMHKAIPAPKQPGQLSLFLGEGTVVIQEEYGREPGRFNQRGIDRAHQTLLGDRPQRERHLACPH